MGTPSPIDAKVLLARLALWRDDDAADATRPVAPQRSVQRARQLAATLAEFEPTALLRAAGVADDAPSRAALRESCDAVADAPRWRLRRAARAAALADAADAAELRAWRRAAPAIEPRSALQRAADALLLGDSGVDTHSDSDNDGGAAAKAKAKALDAGEVAALIEAREWFDGVLPTLPPIEPLRRRLAMLHLLEPMRRLVGEHFVGRRDELARLSDYVGVLPPDAVLGSQALGQTRRFVRQAWHSLRERPPLYVHGPGGVGKSSLLARFILDHVDPDDHAPLPFVHLDFDRAQVEPTLPLTLLIAALQQLRAQFPQHAQAMVRMTEQIEHQLRGTDASESAKSDASQLDVVADFARQVDTMLAGDGGSNGGSGGSGKSDPHATPLLWVMDTFEEPQRLGASTVGALWDLVNDLQRRLPRLRVVICGRVVPGSHTWDRLTLDEFDDEAARSFLRRRFEQLHADAGAAPDAPTIDAIVGAVGRTPLALRLAARLWHDAGSLSGVSQRRLLLFAARSEQIQASLFHRVLEHIRVIDPTLAHEERLRLQDELRRLVHPGLAVRRLTPRIIKEVLAGPCGIALRDAGHAQRLYDALATQVDIVEPSDLDGEPCLLHRSDVRRMMLRDLAAQAGDATVRRIDEGAVAHHRRASDLDLGDGHRAEEIYHRLRLGQTAATIRGRWRPGVERRLGGALDEIDAPRMHVLLADLLGVTLDDRTLRQATLHEWERQTLRRAQQELQAGRPKQALEVLRERSERADGSPLRRIEAETLQLLGRHDEAATLARSDLDDALHRGERRRACEASLILALALEGMRRFDDAVQQLDEALGWVDELGDQVLALRAQVARRRLARLGGRAERDAAASASAERAALAALRDAGVLRELRGRPALLRELLAEFGGASATLMRTGVEVLGIDMASFDDIALVADVLRRWTARPPTRAAAQEVVAKFGVATQPPDLGKWHGWLERSGAREVGSLVLALMREVEPQPSELEGLARLFRRDVSRRVTRGTRSRTL